MSIYNHILESKGYGKIDIIYPADNFEIESEFNVKDSRGVNNIICKLKGRKELFRGRSEVLIFKGNQVYLQKRDDAFRYKCPGGGWEPNESRQTAAIREAQEEVRANVKNCKYALKYVYILDKPAKWIQERIPKKYQWQGYYTELYIAEYDSYYKGDIDEIDKSDMINSIKWLDISKVYNDLPQYYKDAIDLYRKK